MNGLFAPRLWSLMVMGFAGLALGSALGMQYLGGLYPCNLCMTQRYVYVAVIAVTGVLALFGKTKLALASGALLLLGEAGVAYYHWGVELGWIPLPDSCAGVGAAGSFEDFKASILADKPRCDEVAGSFLGLSIAAWNALAASLMAVMTALILYRSFQRKTR